MPGPKPKPQQRNFAEEGLRVLVHSVSAFLPSLMRLSMVWGFHLAFAEWANDSVLRFFEGGIKHTVAEC